ncbi:hypothetical protein CCHR01_11116 [Colletotrichum chrysophilum]|uniref:Uncharacterized protein n=1 Tax=Colletotrichum chrysophilum TaxID=1836956 RepID=A0AAD9AEM7_9PEZI|nr:hypothetical protein CCHR01_11116 [Colletotrichum chrysophilum]
MPAARQSLILCCRSCYFASQYCAMSAAIVYKARDTLQPESLAPDTQKDPPQQQSTNLRGNINRTRPAAPVTSLRRPRARRLLQHFSPRHHRVTNPDMPAAHRALAHPTTSEARTERSGHSTS